METNRNNKEESSVCEDPPRRAQQAPPTPGTPHSNDSDDSQSSLFLKLPHLELPESLLPNLDDSKNDNEKEMDSIANDDVLVTPGGKTLPALASIDLRREASKEFSTGDIQGSIDEGEAPNLEIVEKERAVDIDHSNRTAERPSRWICLNPNYKLRTQLWLSFGTLSWIAVGVVILTCAIASYLVGENTKSTFGNSVGSSAKERQGLHVQYVTEAFAERLFPADLPEIILEAILDRAGGYPTPEGPILPLEWDTKNQLSIVTAANYQDHLQNRKGIYNEVPVSTAAPMFHMQGACDPLETNVTSWTYYPGCTDAHNNLTTGGVVSPNKSTLRLYNWSRKLAPFLKTLYEYDQELRDLGIYWFNDGAGATTNYPAYSLHSTHSYVSVGCGWMRQPNPYDPSRTIGTEEQIAKCRPENEVVNSRVYNPMERGWCRDQALNPESLVIEGPYPDAFLSNQWLVQIGRAVYDRTTNNFLACIYVGVNADYVGKILRESPVFNASALSVVDASTGKVLASSQWRITVDGYPPSIFELDNGVSEELLQRFANLVDFSGSWDPDEVRELYLNSCDVSEGYHVSFFPLPAVPDEYDASYRPQHLVILSTPLDVMYAPIDEANEQVDERVFRVVLFSILFGGCSLAFFSFVLVFICRALTAPLVYMNEKANGILQGFGTDSSSFKEDVNEDEVSAALEKSCAVEENMPPNGAKTHQQSFFLKTEVTDLALEFDKLVDSFAGGSLMPQAAKKEYSEVHNGFSLKHEFSDLYKSRVANNRSHLPGMDAINLGPNIVQAPESSVPDQSFPLQSSGDFEGEFNRQLVPRLLLWILILLVLPLILTMVTISVVSMATLVQDFDDVSNELKAFMFDVELQNLGVLTTHRSNYSSTQLSRSIRDLYVVNRIGGWLLFGGLKATGELPPLQNHMEACKGYDDMDDCPDAAASEVCDCAWAFTAGRTCKNYPGGSRSLQRPFFAVQADMALPNGTRTDTAYPTISYSPNTTVWWETEDLPNQSRNNSSTMSSILYETSYDRARLGGLTLHAAFPIFNYKKRNATAIDFFVTFEEDGLYTGWEGCTSHLHSQGTNFLSSEWNGAASLRPELCPLGRYGYDPRCRGWYDMARSKALEENIPLYVTPPYRRAYGSFFIAQGSIASLVDPISGEVIGHTLSNILIGLVLRALSPRRTRLQDGGFSVLITPRTDSFGGDVVFGPGFNPANSTTIPVADLLLPLDTECAKQGNVECAERERVFNKIVREMKDCKTGSASFVRLTNISGETERLYISYTPVMTGFLDPINSGRFEDGAIFSDFCVFSLAFVETETGLRGPFEPVGEDIERQTRIASAFLALMIIVASVLTIVLSYYIARSMSDSMVALLRAVRLLDTKLVVADKFPDLDRRRGSKEVSNVSKSLETLFEVVRYANLAYYAGATETSYRVLLDSLRIFRKIGNTKAMGVASNNLGNVVLSIYLEMKHKRSSSLYNLTREQLILEGTAYFRNAIKLGEAAYEQFYATEGWTPNCLDFMQHLSNRYFNRGMFLLTVKDDHDQSAEMERLGMRDLQISRDMDVEIVDQGEEVGWGRRNRAQGLFDVCLTRIRGMLFLLELGYSDDEWDIEEKINDLFKTIELESRKTASSDLFTAVSYVGRLQEVEVELMKYFMVQNKLDDAAKVAIRPLIEDEYIFNETKAVAIHVLIEYIAQSSREGDGDAICTTLHQLREDSSSGATTVPSRENIPALSVQVTSGMQPSMYQPTSNQSREQHSHFEKNDTTSRSFIVNDNRFVTMENF